MDFASPIRDSDVPTEGQQRGLSRGEYSSDDIASTIVLNKELEHVVCSDFLSPMHHEASTVMRFTGVSHVIPTYNTYQTINTYNTTTRSAIDDRQLEQRSRFHARHHHAIIAVSTSWHCRQ